MNNKSELKTAFAIGYSINLLRAKLANTNKSSLSENNLIMSEVIFIILSEIKREFRYEFGYDIDDNIIGSKPEPNNEIDGIHCKLQSEFNGYLLVSYLLGGLVGASAYTYPNIADENKFTVILHDFFTELHIYPSHYQINEIVLQLNSPSIKERINAKEALLSHIFQDQYSQSSSIICQITDEALNVGSTEQ